MFEPVKNEKLYQLVVKQVKDLIDNGDLEFGSQIPSERDLAKQLSISRTSVRQAITALEAMGILEIKPGDGTFVKNTFGSREFIDTFVEQLVTLQLSPSEIIETRIILECPIAELCAERVTEEGLLKIENLLEINRIGKSEEVGLEEMNRDFHLEIAANAGNRNLFLHAQALYGMMDFNLWPKLKGHMEKNLDVTKQHIIQHKEIYDAIKSRDGNLAKKLMFKHLNSIEQDFLNEAKNLIDKMEN